MGNGRHRSARFWISAVGFGEYDGIQSKGDGACQERKEENGVALDLEKKFNEEQAPDEDHGQYQQSKGGCDIYFLVGKHFFHVVRSDGKACKKHCHRSHTARQTVHRFHKERKVRIQNPSNAAKSDKSDENTCKRGYHGRVEQVFPSAAACFVLGDKYAQTPRINDDNKGEREHLIKPLPDCAKESERKRVAHIAKISERQAVLVYATLVFLFRHEEFGKRNGNGKRNPAENQRKTDGCEVCSKVCNRAIAGEGGKAQRRAEHPIFEFCHRFACVFRQ